MNSKTSFVKQAAILAAAGITVRFIGFLYRLPLTALLGDQGNGVYGKAYNLYTFLLILSSAGLPAAISKMVSERIARNEPGNAYRVFRVSLIVSGLTGLTAALFLGFGASHLAALIDVPGSPSSQYAMLTLAPTVFIVALMSAFRGYFQGLRNTVPTAISQVVEQIFNAGFSVYLAYVLSKYGVEFAAAGGTAGTGIGAFAGLLVVMGIFLLGRRRFMPREMFLPEATAREILTPGRRGRPEPASRIARELAATAVPIIAGTAIFSITNIIDMQMAGSCLLRAGVFSAQRIDELYGQLTGKYVLLVTLPVSLATALATAVVPNIAAINVTRDSAALHDKINVALKLTMVLSIPSAMGMGVLAGPILRMLFPSHPAGESLLAIGAVSIIFLSLAQITTGMLQGVGHVKAPAFAAFLGGLVKIPINFWLISNPAIHIHGAVISTIACYTLAAAIDLYVLIRVTGTAITWKETFLKPASAALVMGICCYVFYHFTYLFIASNTLAVLIAVSLGVLVYFVYLLLMRGLTAEDLEHIPAGEKLAALCRWFGLL